MDPWIAHRDAHQAARELNDARWTAHLDQYARLIAQVEEITRLLAELHDLRKLAEGNAAGVSRTTAVIIGGVALVSMLLSIALSITNLLRG